jgi:hypothetical protein
MTYNPDENQPYTPEDLADYDDDFRDAPEPENVFRDVPVGTYQAYVERATIEPPNQWSDHPRLKLVCKILSGEYQGAALFPDGSFDPEYIQYLKALTVKMGFDFKSAGEIADSLDLMLDRVLEIAVVKRKSDPTKTNHYVNRFIRMLNDPSDEPPPHTDEDDPTRSW